MCVYLFVCAHVACTHAVCVCVCTCLYGEISRSNLGRARVNSGTNACKSKTEMNTEAKAPEGGGEVWEGGREKIRKSKSAICLVVSLQSEV